MKIAIVVWRIEEVGEWDWSSGHNGVVGCRLRCEEEWILAETESACLLLHHVDLGVFTYCQRLAHLATSLDLIGSHSVYTQQTLIY